MAVPTDVIPRRPTLLVILVLALLFVLMSFSSRTRYVGETRTMFERTVMTIFSPVPKFVNWIGGTAQDMHHGYLDMRRAVNENVELRRKVASLTTENLKLRQSATDMRRRRVSVHPISARPASPAPAHSISRGESALPSDDLYDRSSHGTG